MVRGRFVPVKRSKVPRCAFHIQRRPFGSQWCLFSADPLRKRLGCFANSRQSSIDRSHEFHAQSVASFLIPQPGGAKLGSGLRMKIDPHAAVRVLSRSPSALFPKQRSERALPRTTSRPCEAPLMKRVSFHELAERELNDAAIYYEQENAGLGFKFLEEVERYIGAIIKNPTAGKRIRGQVRRPILRTFPYAILYSVHDSGIRILAIIMNLKRRPLYWVGRS